VARVSEEPQSKCNNFAHTKPKELRKVANDAEERWEQVHKKPALDSKTHECKSGFDQCEVKDDKHHIQVKRERKGDNHKKHYAETEYGLEGSPVRSDYYW
jgi:hypothetical protein